MQVKELWRYPVKSLQGERLATAMLTADGLEGDRRYAIVDLDTDLGLTARRVPELLFASATLTRDEHVRITLPDGSIADGDDALSDWLGRRVALRTADHNPGSRYENVVDFEHEHASAWDTFDGAAGPFHDSNRARVSLLSTATIGQWNPRRFRPNVLLDGAREHSLIGSTVAIGEAIIEVGQKIQRCVMVTRRQPDGIDQDPERPSRDRTRTRRLSRGRRARHPARPRPHRRRASPSIETASRPATIAERSGAPRSQSPPRISPALECAEPASQPLPRRR